MTAEGDDGIAFWVSGWCVCVCVCMCNWGVKQNYGISSAKASIRGSGGGIPQGRGRASRASTVV